MKSHGLKYGKEIEVVKRPPSRMRFYDENWNAVYIPLQREFSILPKRWIVERTLAWINKCRRLSKDYEYLPTTSQAMIYTSMARLMLRRE
ncbi:hypothetical protein DB42_CG00040 [Neochlamydia sp. EPS4]|nr:hypothetical protein DB42_CG00040 [Neochlamydia sp. EPS4]